MFAKWKTSGLSLKAFGEREGIAYAKLLYWKKRVANEPAVVPLRIVEAKPEPVEGAGGVVSIWLSNGVSMEVPSTIAEHDLSRMVRVLSTC